MDGKITAKTVAELRAEIGELEARLADKTATSSAPGQRPTEIVGCPDLLDYSFVQQGRVLKLTGQIVSGWTARNKTYCFSKKKTFDWKFDRKLSVTLSVFPRPSGLPYQYWEPPQAAIIGSYVSALDYSYSEGVLTAEVALLRPAIDPFIDSFERETGITMLTLPNGDRFNPSLPLGLTKDNKKLRLFWRVPCWSYSRSCYYELQLLIVVQPTPGRPAPVYRDWFQRFFPGGLPSLGKDR